MQEIELEERRDIRIHDLPAHAMCINKEMGKMVVARKIEGSPDILEQYNILSGWLAVREKLICPRNGSIESVTFVGNNIVSTHINGSIVISDPHSDKIKRIQICPSPLWSCASADSTHIYLVSHSAVLFTFNCEELVIEKSINLGVDNRLFSVAVRGDQVAVGGSDTIFIVKDGILKHTLNVPRKEKRLPTIVWSIAFMKENLAVSGDSRGVLCFWNTESGALIQELLSHQADILTLCPHKDDTIVAAGVDPRIMTAKEVSPNNFRIISKRNGPIRDVKAIAECDDRIYAVGDDFDLFVGKQGCQSVKLQRNKRLVVKDRLVMTIGYNFVDLYTAGDGEEDLGNGEIIVARQPVYLARIMSPSNLPITACDLSADGSIIALSTPESTTLYRINNKRKKQVIERLPIEGRPATAVKVLKNWVILTCGDFEVHKVSLDIGEGEQILEQSGCGAATQLAVSSCERYAAVITTRLEVFVVDMKARESRPVRVDLPIDITFADGGSLVVLTAIPGFENPDKTQKVLFEFPAAGGALQRSAAAPSIFSTPLIRAVGISAGPDNQLLVVGDRGQWVLINKDRTNILPYLDQTVSPTSIQLRSGSRICLCYLEVPQPETAPFRLKKYQNQ